MYIIIVGAGGIGKRLTEISLKDSNHNVIVIDKDQAKCEEIAGKPIALKRWRHHNADSGSRRRIRWIRF